MLDHPWGYDFTLTDAGHYTTIRAQYAITIVISIRCRPATVYRDLIQLVTAVKGMGIDLRRSHIAKSQTIPESFKWRAHVLVDA